MDRTRWEALQALFHEAADLLPEAQRAFVALRCGGDDSLAREVMAMLERDARGATLLDCGVARVAGDVLGSGLPFALTSQPFGPYRLIQRLGEGGMGVVCLARRDDLGSVAAIKIMRDAWLSPSRRDRFLGEQRILAQLNHPAIARLFDADTLPDGTPWFAMEYVEGVPITDYCDAHAAPVDARLRLFGRVCEAVQHAHRLMVVHRDLKPSNILVTADGGVKLLDFGISKQLDTIESPPHATRTGLRLMTPAYAAPEQIRGEATGVQTDVYALGVILYELLAGCRPHDLSGLTPSDAERVILERDPARPSAVARLLTPPRLRLSDSLWDELDVLTLTAMHKDAARRYASVESLMRDVLHFLAGQPLEARPDTLGYRAHKFVRRNRRPLAAAAAAAALIVSLTAVYTVQLAHARDAAVAEAVRTERLQRFVLSLFDAGETGAAPDDDLRVIDLVDRGAQQAALLDREPLAQAELNQTLGGIYQRLGKLDRAETLLSAAVEQRRARLSADAPDLVRSQIALARLRADQARFDEAEQVVREALRRASAPGRRDDTLVADATSALGELLYERGRYADAIAVLEDAVRLREAANADPVDVASTLYQLASAHFYVGQLDTSETLNQQVVALQTSALGPRHPLVAQGLINLGAIQVQRGRYAEAVPIYRDALAITIAWYGDDSHHTASNLTMLARALQYQDALDEAHTLLERALVIQERVFGAVHPRVASALNDLGAVALKRRRLDEAEAHFRRIVDIYRAVYGDRHYTVGIGVSNVASVFVERQEYPTAERLFREAAERFASAQAPDHLNTGIARIKLGRAILRQARFAEAEPELRSGYEIVAKQAAPTVSWLTTAREDLAAAYDALGEPAKAARFRDEAAKVAQQRR